jgi:hypothetical protein
MANRSNPFPLQGVKRVAVIGAGDSGNVTVEALLGYGPEIGQAPQELDRVLSVDWYGQEAKTKEQFETCRNRYAQLANDFPRKSNPSADYRISPIPVKAVGLSRAEDGRLRVKDLMGTKRDYDLVIDCSGFDRTPVAQYFDPKLVVQVNEETTRATKGKSKRSAGARSESPPLDYFGADQVTAAIKLLESQLLKASYIPLEVLGYSQRVTDIARVTPDQLATVRGGNWLIELGGGTFVLASRGALKTWAGTSLIQSKFDDSQTILENLKRLLGRPSLFDSPDAEPNLLLFVADRNVLSTVQTAAEEAKSDGNPSGPLSPVFGTINGEKVEIAQKVSGQEVYVIGPETNLTFTGKERNKIQANFIAEIIGAVFLFSGRITTLAEILAERGRIGEADADGRSESRDRPAKVELKWGERMYNTEARLFLEPSPVVGRLLGPTIDPQTVVEAFVRYAYRDHRPDYTQSALTFSARLDNRSKKPPILNFQTSHALPIPIHEDPVFVRACHILLTRPPYRPNGEVNEFTITVPTRGRYDAQAEFAWSNAVYTAKPASTPRFGANRSTLTTAEVQQKIRESGKSRKAPER